MSDYADRPLDAWGQVLSGKWHRIVDGKPSLYRREWSLCGVRFIPDNVGWHGLPDYADPSSVCQKCAASAP